MVYSGIYLLPKSNSSSTLKSEQNSNNLNNINNQPNVTNNNVPNRLKHSKKLSSTGSTSNRSSESSRFNETSSNNVTIKSDLNKFNKNPKLAPEIIFLIKEHAKTLDKINQISKRLQEIELKVDDISQRLSRDNSLNNSNNYHKPVVNNHQNNDRTLSSSSNDLIQQRDKNQKEFNQQQIRLLNYNSTYKDVDHHLSNNLSNNATNIPNNQILSDDSGGEYGNKTNKTVSDDELLSILDKITKCSHHILQTQQAYQQQSSTIYNSLSKPYAYTNNNNGLISHQFNQLNNQLSNNIQSNRQQYQQQDIYNQQPNLYMIHEKNMIPYLLNAKSSIKTTTNQKLPNNIEHQQNIIHQLKYNAPQQTGASLNELLFEPNVERFLSNLDQLVCNDDSNLAAILGTNQHQSTNALTNNLMNSQLNPAATIIQQKNHQQFIPLSPHQATSALISNQSIPINNLRNNCLNSNLSPNNLINSQLNSSYNLGQQHILNLQSSINNQPYNLNNISLNNSCSPNFNHQQQFLNWQKARELIEKKERERVDNQLKEADEWLGMVDNCINRNKYQQSAPNKNKQSQHNNSIRQGGNIKGDKNDALKTFDS